MIRPIEALLRVACSCPCLRDSASFPARVLSLGRCRGDGTWGTRLTTCRSATIDLEGSWKHERPALQLASAKAGRPEHHGVSPKLVSLSFHLQDDEEEKCFSARSCISGPSWKRRWQLHARGRLKLVLSCQVLASIASSCSWAA